MAKSIKPKNDTYIDSKGIVHERTLLSTFLDSIITKYSGTIQAGETANVDLSDIFGIVIIRCMTANMEVHKTYVITGPNGWVYDAKELSSLKHTIGGDAEISISNSDGKIRITITNTGTTTFTYLIGILKCL